MGRMRHIAGRGVSKQHSTVIEAAAPIVKFLQKLPEVSNIGLGRLDIHLPTTEWRIKISETRGGLKLQIRGTNSIQQIMVYTSSTVSVIHLLSSEFGIKYKVIS